MARGALEKLGGYAIEHSIREKKVHRFIEGKMKAYLLAWTRFVALYERIRKSFPVAPETLPESTETENEPIPTVPKPIRKAIYK